MKMDVPSRVEPICLEDCDKPSAGKDAWGPSDAWLDDAILDAIAHLRDPRPRQDLDSRIEGLGLEGRPAPAPWPAFAHAHAAEISAQSSEGQSQVAGSDAFLALIPRVSESLEAVQKRISALAEVLRDLGNLAKSSSTGDVNRVWRLFHAIISAVADEGARLSGLALKGENERRSPGDNGPATLHAEMTRPRSRSDADRALLRQAGEAIEAAQRQVPELMEVLRGLVDLTEKNRPRDLKEVQRLLAQARRLVAHPASEQVHDGGTPENVLLPSSLAA